MIDKMLKHPIATVVIVGTLAEAVERIVTAIKRPKQ